MNKKKAPKINWKNFTIDDLTFQKTSHYGHNVSHAKNRTSRAFKRNLHRATVIINGIKHKIQVPTGILRKLKALGLTTHKVVNKA